MIKRLFCFILGHDMVEEGKYDNGRSLMGDYFCLRCGKRHHWQYDK